MKRRNNWFVAEMFLQWRASRQTLDIRNQDRDNVRMIRLEPMLFLLLVMAAFVMVLPVILWFVWRRQRSELGRSTGEQALLFNQQIDGLRQQLAESLNQGMSLMSQQMAQMTTQMNAQMGAVTQQLVQTTGQIGHRLDSAAKVVGEVRQNLGELSKSAERILEVGKDISGLQEILRAPKLRGALGELFLGDLLAQILPPNHFSLQYSFKGGEVVDAVIHLGQGLVPIDSKFPLENFRRLIESQGEEEKKANRKRFVSDLKRHIDFIAMKYILPDEGTLDFALMYIPAENVYYEAIIRDETFADEKGIANYALAKRVIPVSPCSFYAYLQAILLGLKGLRIEKSAQEIIQHLARLQGDFSRFREDFEVIGKHLNNTRSRYDEASKRLDRLGEKLEYSSAALNSPAPSASDPVSEKELNPSDRLTVEMGSDDPALIPQEQSQSKLL